MKDINNDHSNYLIKRLLKNYVWQYKAKLFYAIILMIIAAISTASVSIIMEPMINNIFVENNKVMLVVIPLIIIFIFCVKGFSSYGQAVIMKILGQRVVIDMQEQLYAHLIYSDLKVINNESSGQIVSRFTNDINLLRQSISTVFTGIIRDSLTFIFLLGAMIYQSFSLSIIAFVVFPVAVFPILKIGRRMRKISVAVQQRLGSLTANLDETFKGIKTIKAYAKEDYEVEKAKKVLNEVFIQYKKSSVVSSIASPIMEIFSGFAVALVIWYGGTQITSGEITIGAFISFIIALLMTYKPIKSLSSLNASLQTALAAADRLFTILDIKPKITDDNKSKAHKSLKGKIEFSDVKFSYNEEVAALNGVSFQVPKGKTVALVGASGSGKSTIVNLILRFYDVDSGKIFIDDKEINEFKLKSLRQNISIVSQDIFLFDDTIKANIAYGIKKISDTKIKQAAKMAQAEDFIEDLPDKYETIIGQNGHTLSGGQRQRIAIARAILKDAPILLLDEATSSLDPISEKKIQGALERLIKANKTKIIVAHRLSTVINADIIYVLKKGKVVESGTHEQLLKNKGIYSKLYKGLDQ